MELLTTDLGNFKKENVQWLYMMGFITSDGGIIGKSSRYPCNAISLLIEIKNDLIDNMQDKPKQVIVDLDDIITLFRTGLIEKNYQYEGQNYTWKKTRDAYLDSQQMINEWNFIRAKVEEANRKKFDSFKRATKKKSIRDIEL